MHVKREGKTIWYGGDSVQPIFTAVQHYEGAAQRRGCGLLKTCCVGDCFGTLFHLGETQKGKRYCETGD